jgi:hypothetical protein
MFSGSIVWRGVIYSTLMILGKLACSLWLQPLRKLIQTFSKAQPGSQSVGAEAIYPAFILGFAMVARGEIGFLISSIAESKGIFGAQDSESSPGSDVFLIVSWAIVLCTVMGPICVGLCFWNIRRKTASQELERPDEENDVWGIWTVKAGVSRSS